MMAVLVRVLAVGNVYPPHHLGGYEIIWQGVMDHLRERGNAVRVLASDYTRSDGAGAGPEDPDVHRDLEWYWRDHQWRSLGFRDRLGLERRNAERFERHLAEFRPEVITWWSVGGMSLSLIERARRAGVPAVLFVLDPWTSYGPEHDLWLRTWRRLKPARAAVGRLTGIPAQVDLAAAGRWVFCSQTMRENTLATGVRPAQSTILSPGVARQFTDYPVEADLPSWQGRLLYVGRVVEQKGVHVAIAALSRLPPSARLKIVGEGDLAYRERLEAMAVELGVRERVEFAGAKPRRELPEVFRAADAVVFPVEWPEPWGLVPLEAMALGRPVLATGRGGSGDYLVDGRNTLLFEAGHAEALAAVVQSLAGDPALRERLRTGGLETARRHTEDEFNRRAGEEIAAASRAPLTRPR